MIYFLDRVRLLCFTQEYYVDSDEELHIHTSIEWDNNIVII